MIREDLEHTRLKEIRLECPAGAYIGNCQTEALWLAVDQWTRVVFEHNGRLYTVDPHALVAAIAVDGPPMKD